VRYTVDYLATAWGVAKQSCSPNSAVEQAASAARPWQRAQRRQCGSGGPRPVLRPPLLTAGVMWFCGLSLIGPIDPSPSLWRELPERRPGRETTMMEARCRLAREIVTFDVCDTSLAVSAEYTFMKRPISADEEGIVFPFLDDPSMGDPSLVDATISYDDGPYSTLDVNTLSTDYWICHLDGSFTRSAMVRLAYTQPLRSRRAGYHLTSRSRCTTPVDSAVFIVRFRPTGRKPNFSLPFARQPTDSPERIWIASFTNWTPKKELRIRW
jgi:hypothetical protein